MASSTPPDDPLRIIEADDDPPPPAPSLITKLTDHPLREIVLGTVVAVEWLHDSLLFYYADGHKAQILQDDEGELMVTDYEIAEC